MAGARWVTVDGPWSGVEAGVQSDTVSASDKPDLSVWNQKGHVCSRSCDLLDTNECFGERMRSEIILRNQTPHPRKRHRVFRTTSSHSNKGKNGTCCRIWRRRRTCCRRTDCMQAYFAGGGHQRKETLGKGSACASEEHELQSTRSDEHEWKGTKRMATHLMNL